MAWIVAIIFGLILLFSFPKQMLAVLGVLVISVVAIIAFFYYGNMMKDKEKKRQAESILILAGYKENCPPDFPIMVITRNKYKNTILSLNFDLSGYREGYSSPVYRGRVSTDKIIEPGETHVACWSVPALNYGTEAAPPQDLTWKATYSYATFGNAP